MGVKVTQREPTEGSVDAGLRARKLGLWPRSEVEQVYRNAHDAAPDDGTRALVDLLWAVQQLRHGPNSDYAVHARYVDTYLGKFTRTDEGAALIRQAEERDDG